MNDYPPGAMSSLGLMAGPTGFGLRSRHSECEALARLVASVRDGQSKALVLHGEAGLGKTKLLEYLHTHASGCRVARAAGTEAEQELAFAGLHQLCAPFLTRIEHLPDPQRDALGRAFSIRAGDKPDRFAIGTAVLGVLCAVAAEQPLICIIDDAQWLDRPSAHALAFVARRLTAQPVGIVFAVRHPRSQRHLAGLPELEVKALRNTDARELLDSLVRWPLERKVRSRIVAEARGNPRTLLNLARGMRPAALAGGFRLPDAAGVPAQITDSFRRKAGGLPRETRLLLLLAAAEPTGDPALVRRAAKQMGLDSEATDNAVAAGILEIGRHLTFCDPTVRPAVYRSAPLGDRRTVHRALAEATDPDFDPDRRAWHRAQAVADTDEEVGEELERSAAGAQASGGFPAAAAFLERSAELTADPARRARRGLTAAAAHHHAGAHDAALTLLATAEAEPLDELHSARADLLRGLIAAASGNRSDAPALLIKAAKRLELLNLELAAEAYRDAFHAALTAGTLAAGGGIQEVAHAARSLTTRLPRSPRSLLLHGLATLVASGPADAAPALKQALTALRTERLRDASELRWLVLACCLARELWDDESWTALSDRLVEDARGSGALAALQVGLNLALTIRVRSDGVAAATSLATEADQLSEATAAAPPPYAALVIAACRGRAADLSALVTTATTQLVARGEGQWLAAAHWATAALNNGLGRHRDALTAAEYGTTCTAELRQTTWLAVELIEAAARTGHTERAADALTRLSATTSASGSNWALGLEARSRALLSAGSDAEQLYREAIDRLTHTRVRSELARAHLIYGEWLRRENRRVDARTHLRAAHEILTTLGFEGFAERARRELAATGETVPKRDAAMTVELTPQETQIVRLARDGRTNPEIAAQLFLSARTVEWHLRKIFAKLGISSRRELRDPDQ